VADFFACSRSARTSRPTHNGTGPVGLLLTTDCQLFALEQPLIYQHFPGRLLQIPISVMIKALDEALASIAGVSESQLSRHVAAGLPDSAPGPPWDCPVSSVFWSHKAKPGAEEALPEVLRGSPRVPVTIGALIRYIDSPVGPYSEVIAAPAFVRRPFPQAHVAFIAVDSETSVVGGRANWAFPKVLARFEGTIGLPGEATVVGRDWTVGVGTSARPLRLPTWLRYSCCQVWPDLTVRHFPLKVQGWSRWATVDVEVTSAGTLGTWLASGRHTGFSFAGRLRVGPARP
jgi:Acetoacetate decarboxylase (ADC)